MISKSYSSPPTKSNENPRREGVLIYGLWGNPRLVNNNWMQISICIFYFFSSQLYNYYIAITYVFSYETRVELTTYNLHIISDRTVRVMSVSQ